jgi:shikimate dehydrogenase
LSSLYGLLGEKLGHSLSPAIHSMIFKELNIEAHYHLFEVKPEELVNAVQGLRALGVKGVNVTIPYKTPVMEYLDDISREALEIGAVNTICFREGKTIGYNTDYHGFGMMLEQNAIDIRGKTAVILGSGGSAKGVLQYLLDNGIGDVKIVSRDVSRLKEDNGFRNIDLISYEKLKCVNNGDIIINCTPCGMYPNVEVSPLEKDTLYGFPTVVDLIYNPRKTFLLKYAEEAGAKTVNGLYMLVGQAVAAEEVWNNVSIQRDIVDKIYRAIL